MGKHSEEIQYGYRRALKRWRELCPAGREAKDPNELLELVLELNQSLKHEEQVRHDFREPSRATSSCGELRS